MHITLLESFPTLIVSNKRFIENKDKRNCNLDRKYEFYEGPEMANLNLCPSRRLSRPLLLYALALGLTSLHAPSLPIFFSLVVLDLGRSHVSVILLGRPVV